MKPQITDATIEAVRRLVRLHNPAYEEETGMGPCGALAVVLARAGWGEIAFVETTDAEKTDDCQWYPHYVIIGGDGEIIDVSGEYMVEIQPTPVYREIMPVEESDILQSGPGTVYRKSDVDFWQARLAEVI
jgi:hypothetical protein